MKRKLIIILFLCCILTTGCKINNLSSNNQETLGNNNGNITATVEVNGTKIKFPCTIQDLKDAGFILKRSDDSIDEQLKEGTYYVFTGITDFMLIGSGVYIIGEDLNNSKVIGGTFEQSQIQTEKYSINGLEIGKATVQEAIDMFGKPTEPLEYDPNDYNLSLDFGNYTQDSSRFYELKMTFQKGILRTFTYIENDEY